MDRSGLTYRAPNILPLEKRLMLDASLPAISGQVLWLDANDASTVSDADGDNAATGTGGANNGFSGAVATWRDKSGSNFHVTSTNAAERPLYTMNALNGKNVLTFDGTNDKMTNLTASIPGNDVTIFLVFNRTTAAGRDAVFEIGNGGSRNALFMNEPGSPNKLSYYVNSTFYHSSGTYTTGTYEIASIVHDANSINLWRGNNNQINTTGLARAATTGIFVGDDSSSGDQLQGNIAEIIVYDRDLSADERHDVETYLAGKWGRTITNAAPVVATNAGATLLQGSATVLTNAMLSATDTDNSEPGLRYTITDLADYGALSNTNTSHTYTLGETFLQSDIDNGYIRYTHNNTANFSDSFSFTVTDRAATTAAANFNLTITPSNLAPVIQGWTLISSENFESGAAGWNDNLTETGGAYLTRFLGRHSQDGGLQSTFKTYTLSGTQDQTIVVFDAYKIDTWDGEFFRVFINDGQVVNLSLTQGVYTSPADGVSGIVSYTVQEMTPFLANLGFGGTNDQIFRFTLTVSNAAAASLKLGFGSTLDQAVADESWGVDNIAVYESGPSGTPGPIGIIENSLNGTVVGRIIAKDPDAGQSVTYAITGGTGAGLFAINAASGIITVTNGAALNYESVTSYTLNIRATDNGTPSLQDNKTITINILDLPENTAPSVNALGPLSVAENAANNTVIGTITGSDPQSNTITWSITNGNADNIFAINAATGAIRVNNNANLNFDYRSLYTLTVTGTDNGFGNLSTSRAVTVNITNVNEAPTFNITQSFLNQNPHLRYNPATGNFYQYVGTTANHTAANAAATAATLNGVAGHLATITSLAENTYVRGLGGGNIWLGATDASTEGTWVWGGSGTEGGNVFWLGAAAGSAQNGYYTNWLSGDPNNSGNEDYLEMQASGRWNDVVSTAAKAYVIEWEGSAVLAGLGNGPMSLAENPVMNQSVGFVHARDQDAGDTLSYSITGGTGAGLFSMNAATGEIRVTDPSAINYEDTKAYTLNIRVTDALGLSDTLALNINILDANDVPSAMSLSNNRVVENSGSGTVIGTFTGQDEDAGDLLTFSLMDNANGMFAIVGNQLRTVGAIDYEQNTSFTIVVRVDDGNGGTLDRTYMIGVDDVMDTFTPPPANGGGAGITVLLPALPAGVSGERVDLLGAGLSGAESAFGAYYGHQILRENLTFRLLETYAAADLENTSMAEFTVADARFLEFSQTLFEQSIAQKPDYTNLREALVFLQAMADKNSDSEKVEDNVAADREKSLPATALDRRFVDVMTYHEDRAARLRQALLS